MYGINVWFISETTKYPRNFIYYKSHDLSQGIVWRYLRIHVG